MTRRGLLGFLSGAGASAVILTAKAVVKRAEVKLPEPEEYFVSQAFGRVPIPKGTIKDLGKEIEGICREARRVDSIIDARNAKDKKRMEEHWEKFG